MSCVEYVMSCEEYVMSCEEYVMSCEEYVMSCVEYVMSCEVNSLVPSTHFLVSQSQDTWNQAERMRNTYNAVTSLWKL